ncbi:MAG: hypothetical protein R2783_05290 [Gelidibacter sp.]
MDNLQQKLKDTILKFQLTVKRGIEKTGKKEIILGSIIGTFLGLSPYLFYLYESVPEKQIWHTFLFTYNSGAWGNANLSMWILTGKLLPLLFLIIWFFTCRHWWYHALLVPITMYIYQIVLLLYEDATPIDEFQLLYLVPLMAMIVPSIYLIRAQMFNKLNDADKTFEELEQEFMIKPTTLWGKIKQYF